MDGEQLGLVLRIVIGDYHMAEVSQEVSAWAHPRLIVFSDIDVQDVV